VWVHRGLGHGAEQLFLVPEVVVERGLFDAQALRELSGADGVETDLVEQVERLAHDGLPVHLHIDNLSVIGDARKNTYHR
jgi:hypothetical protein